MDSCPPDQQRHKRTFDEMSQQASLSPSPFFFGHQTHPGPLDNPPNIFERRRTSHPHNQASQSSYNFPDNMPEPRAAPRPNLDHRNSQTIIDLTGDTGEPSVGGINSRFMSRPPLLGRTDAALALEDIIDLTNDVIDDELEIIDARRISEPQSAPQVNNRNRQLPQPRPRMGHGRALLDDSPSLFIPQEQVDLRPMARDREQQRHRQIFPDNPLNRIVGFAGQVAGQVAGLLGPRLADEHFQVVYLGNPAVPEFNYGQPAFRQRPQAKPQHQPPPPAKSGFTRSPTEDDVVICPACLNELVAHKTEDDGAFVKKPHGRAANKKDREEHHFWVVKECGHVYCNKCYQGRRRPDRRKPSIFPEVSLTSGKIVPTCAVEGCNKDVGDKKHWVGIFI